LQNCRDRSALALAHPVRLREAARTVQRQVSTAKLKVDFHILSCSRHAKHLMNNEKDK
jgi:hypothetical protein